MTLPLSVAGEFTSEVRFQKPSFLRIAVPSFGNLSAAAAERDTGRRVSREELLRLFGMDLRRAHPRASADLPAPADLPVVVEQLPAGLRPAARPLPALTEREQRDHEISVRLRQALYPQKVASGWR